jgi:hypothetical protein
MRKDLFQTLTENLVEAKFDPDLDWKGKPRKNRARGEVNDTVTKLLVAKPVAAPCEWCEGVCTSPKTYRRSPGSKIWNAKCGDCDQKRHFYPGQEEDE